MKLRVLPTQIVISHGFTCRKGREYCGLVLKPGGITIQTLTQASANVNTFQGFSSLQQIFFQDDWMAPLALCIVPRFLDFFFVNHCYFVHIGCKVIYDLICSVYIYNHYSIMNHDLQMINDSFKLYIMLYPQLFPSVAGYKVINVNVKHSQNLFRLCQTMFPRSTTHRHQRDHWVSPAERHNAAACHRTCGRNVRKADRSGGDFMGPMKGDIIWDCQPFIYIILYIRIYIYIYNLYIYLSIPITPNN